MSAFIDAWALQSTRIASRQRDLEARYQLLAGIYYDHAGQVLTLEVHSHERGIVYRVRHTVGLPEWFELLCWYDADDVECTPRHGPMPGDAQLEIAEWLRTSRQVREAYWREREHAIAMEDDRS